MTSDRRVLCICPSFPPVSYPDCMRLRLTLPYFKEFGWHPTVLCIDSKFIEGPIDYNLTKLLPPDLSVIYSYCIPPKWSNKVGVTNLVLRALPFLILSIEKLLSQGFFDLVFFSTTVFLSMPLGRYWHSKYGLPYVLDFQDPWVNDYYICANHLNPPGGRFKHGLSQTIAKVLESWTLRHVSHVISVSPQYPKTLLARYPWLKPDQFTVLPFGASETDFEVLPKLNIQQKIFDPNDGKRHWVYVGRGGNDMALALRTLFLGIQSERHCHPEQWHSVQLHFVGTSYTPKHRAVKTVEPIAQELGVGDLVTEHTHRIPYFEALQVLVDSDAILLIGSNDSGYTASKLYPCILARKPILAIFHQESSVVDILHRCQAGRAITFAPENKPEDLLAEVSIQLQKLLSLAKGYQPETNWTAFQPYTAREMTRKQCVIFDQCLTSVIQSQ